MKASAKMQRVVEQLAAKHGVDLAAVGAHLRLEMPHFDPLVIENIGPNRVSVCHYYRHPSGDSLQDPEIEFVLSTDPHLGGWYPYAITQLLTGYSRVAEVDAEGRIVRISVRAQADVAQFATMWARNIESQGWIDRACATSLSAQEA